ncbi:MAG TPA: 4Fe-4S binding protein [Candidatus Stercoripulliclostridium merdipullorum]|uniref:4Fe-4S binding protein n=1 Tax=Candidatus Stercoripulliclostridium merdipullorum TaxID=2840952 RepID=A0A9D1NE16_9FIRM|nr:4Fe-4S binding protein [Candidatus Stercoripulliclostridium merdipullorum]
MDKSLHTVTLDSEKCKGCIACMKRCPTEAIRVRGGKAKVLYDRCVGCGECVRICPNQAKLPSYDPFEMIERFKYRVAVPAPSLYGQFNNLTDIDTVLNGLLEIGFDDVFEVSRGAELITEVSRKVIAENKIKRPVISTACPAIVELIMVRYHDLADHLLDLQAPVDIALRLAREEAIQKGIPAEDIGVFFISPCPAKVFALKTGLGLKAPSADGVLSISEVYFKLISAMPKLKSLRPLAKTGIIGLQWASSGGEAAGLFMDKYLAADGVENAIEILNEIDNEKLNYIDFVELNACAGGCVGGVLNIENPFVAKARIRSLRRNLQLARNNVAETDKPLSYFRWEVAPEIKDVYRLDEDRMLALEKMKAIDAITKSLPNLDCGSCGAPSCRAFAEDVVNGEIDRKACVRENHPYET